MGRTAGVHSPRSRCVDHAYQEEAMKPDDYEGDWVDCYECGGEGWISRYEEDPLWYDENEEWRCEVCLGAGGWRLRKDGKP